MYYCKSFFEMNCWLFIFHNMMLIFNISWVTDVWIKFFYVYIHVNDLITQLRNPPAVYWEITVDGLEKSFWINK